MLFRANAQEETPPSIADKTAGMERLDGFFDVYWDDNTGKLYWEIDKFDEEFLYAVSLSSGLGSNPVGLDRGQLGGEHILEAKRIGPRVLLMEPNYTYRAISDNPDEVQAVKDAFAPSVHWGFDVAAETGGSVLVDYATPIDESLTVRWVARHRLEKKNPEAARSEPVEPIVYYLDRGVPEPVRSALLDGARWWNEAFEAAGFIDAFRVEVLPADADPNDVRYNIIHWTHRSTRGWSYGSSVADPRTGEIIKGNVNYYYALRDDNQTPVTIVPGREQRRALATIVRTLEADFLEVPENILEMIPPPAYRYSQGERFPRHTGLLFDPLTAADVSADYTVELLLHPERMARVVDYHSRNNEYPGLDEVVDAMFGPTWNAATPADTYYAQVQEVAERSVLDGVMEQASSADNQARVRAVLSAKLDELAEQLDASSAPSPHQKLALEDIRRWHNRPAGTVPGSTRPKTPAGSPLGASQN